VTARTEPVDRSNRLAPILGGIASVVGPYVGLLLIVALFAWLTRQDGRFMGAENWQTIAFQSVIVGMVALGMTQIMIAGGIDLSVGSMVALVTVLIARMVQGVDVQVGSRLMHLHLWVPFAMLGGVAIGGLCGLINGSLVVRLGVVPFIITLGTMKAFRGLAKWFSGSTSVYIDSQDKPSWFSSILSVDIDASAGLRSIGLNPIARMLDGLRAVPGPLGRLFDLIAQLAPGVWLLFFVAAGVAVILNYSLLGRYFYAVGSNESTARLCGLAVGRVKLSAYGLAGMLAGLAGALQFALLGGTGDPTTADGLELEAIAAVVIGGGSLAGGEGKVSGTLVGVLIMSVLRSGCVHANISNATQDVLIGSIIILAVAIDRYRRVVRD
jgi:ribose transport system permease protein